MNESQSCTSWAHAAVVSVFVGSVEASYKKRQREGTMLWTICLILFILWLLGFFSGYAMGGLIHVLLVIAVIVLIVGLIQRRRS
jgi:lipopolysaccharide export LptBFGC system permease protein LptF